MTHHWEEESFAPLATNAATWLVVILAGWIALALIAVGAWTIVSWIA